MFIQLEATPVRLTGHDFVTGNLTGQVKIRVGNLNNIATIAYFPSPTSASAIWFI